MIYIKLSNIWNIFNLFCGRKFKLQNTDNLFYTIVFNYVILVMFVIYSLIYIIDLIHIHRK